MNLPVYLNSDGHRLGMVLDPSHKSHNASGKYPTHVHISVTKWCIVGYGSDALWDLGNRSIVPVLSSEVDMFSCLHLVQYTAVYGHYLETSAGQQKWGLVAFTWQGNRVFQNSKKI